MNSDKPSFERDLWGQYTKLHNRITTKIDYYKNILKDFEPIEQSLSSLNKKLSTIKIKKDTTIPQSLYENKDSNEELYGIPLSINLFKTNMAEAFDNYYLTLCNMTNSLQDLIKKMSNERNYYDDVIKTNNNFIKLKRIMEGNLKIYQSKLDVAENSVKSLKQLDKEVKSGLLNYDDPNILKQENSASKMLNDAITPFYNYKDSVNKAEESRQKYIEAQKSYLFFSQENEENIIKSNISILKIFFTLTNLQEGLNKSFEKDIENQIEKTNLNKEIREFILENAGREKPEPEITFQYFKSKLDFDQMDNDTTYELYRDVVGYIREKIPEEYPNYVQELQKEKNDTRNTLVKLFSSYSIEGEKEILNRLSNTKIHKFFLIVLSKLRTNNRFEQNDNVVQLLGKIMNVILHASEQSEDLDNAKNCIILSQTFYYQNGDKKIYLIDYIRNNKWLKSSDFWFKFISKMVEKEIGKYLDLNKDLTRDIVLKEPEKLNKQQNSKLSEILFSQLLPYVNNMNEFHLSENHIIFITEVFCNKYKFLSKEQKDSIYALVGANDSQIRKEMELAAQHSNILDQMEASISNNTYPVKEEKKITQIKEENNIQEDINSYQQENLNYNQQEIQNDFTLKNNDINYQANSNYYNNTKYQENIKIKPKNNKVPNMNVNYQNNNNIINKSNNKQNNYTNNNKNNNIYYNPNNLGNGNNMNYNQKNNNFQNNIKTNSNQNQKYPKINQSNKKPEFNQGSKNEQNIPNVNPFGVVLRKIPK